VDCAYDADVAGDNAVTLGEPRGGPQIRLWNRTAPEENVIQLCAEVAVAGATDNLVAAVHGVQLAVMGEDLTPFLDALVEGYAGWEGVRTWRSLYREVEIGAVSISGGHVELTCTPATRLELGGRHVEGVGHRVGGSRRADACGGRGRVPVPTTGWALVRAMSRRRRRALIP
jgi:hypothetical protein